MAVGRSDIGFLLALAGRRWNQLLEAEFAEAGFGEVRASYGSLLVPLLEEDGLRMSELARRAHLTKQTVTTMTRLLERDGLVELTRDPDDARATRVYLSRRGRSFRPVAERVLRRLDDAVARTLTSRRAADLRRALTQLVDLETDTRR